MSKPSEARLRAAVAIGLTVLSFGVLAGVSQTGGQLRDGPEPALTRGPTTATVTKPTSGTPKESRTGYSLRCWQYGRLLFEEHLTVLPTDSRNVVRLAANDPAGRPVQVVETTTATCLIRAASATEERSSASEERSGSGSR
jgi:hypothetical protein